MKFTRFTIKNHKVHPNQKDTYRIPGNRVGEFFIKSFNGDTVHIQGELVDKLGRYEDLGEPEELERKLAIYRKE